jgi:hypothetical protein
MRPKQPLYRLAAQIRKQTRDSDGHQSKPSQENSHDFQIGNNQ